MAYRLTTTWVWETWGANYTEFTPYSRIAARPVAGGSLTGTVNPFLTDVPRGITFIVNGTTVKTQRNPSQDDLAAAEYYYQGGAEYIIDDSMAQIFINAGYGDYVTQL